MKKFNESYTAVSKMKEPVKNGSETPEYNPYISITGDIIDDSENHKKNTENVLSSSPPSTTPLSISIISSIKNQINKIPHTFSFNSNTNNINEENNNNNNNNNNDEEKIPQNTVEKFIKEEQLFNQLPGIMPANWFEHPTPLCIQYLCWKILIDTKWVTCFENPHGGYEFFFFYFLIFYLSSFIFFYYLQILQ